MQGATSVADIKKRARWYVTVRWFYVLAIAVPGILSLLFSGSDTVQIWQDLAVVVAILIVNVAFLAGTYIDTARRNIYELLVMGQIVFDLIIMASTFYINAGVETPIAMLFAIPILMSAAFFTRAEVYMTGVTASGVFAALALLDHFGILPDLNIVAPQLHDNAAQFFPILITTTAILLVITAIVGMVSQLIQERERLTEEMRSLSARHAETEAILRTMGSALVAVSRDGIVTTVNDSFEKLTGWKHVDVVGRLLEDILPMVDVKGKRVEAAYRPMQQYMNDNHLNGSLVQAVTGYSYIRKDGTTFPFVGHIAPIIHSRSIVGFTMVFDDISENKKLDQLKDNFIALISHQLKTPIGEINGYAYNLLGGVGGDLNKKQTEYVTEIQELAARAGKLIVDLLDIVLAGRGNLTVHNEPVEIGPIITLVAKLRHEQAEKKGLQIVTNTPSELIFVRGDDQKLVQAIGNLVDNAIRYSKHGAITISVTPQTEQVEVRVRDEGSGMDPATVALLFGTDEHEGPLAHAPTAEGGTGLGVYLAKQLIALMDGSIRVESSTSDGTTICVTFERVKP